MSLSYLEFGALGHNFRTVIMEDPVCRSDLFAQADNRRSVFGGDLARRLRGGGLCSGNFTETEIPDLSQQLKSNKNTAGYFISFRKS